MNNAGKSISHEWDDLVEWHLRGELREVEQERLAEFLDRDASLRKDFVQRAAWDNELMEVFRAGGDDKPKPAASPRAAHVWRWVSGSRQDLGDVTHPSMITNGEMECSISPS